MSRDQLLRKRWPSLALLRAPAASPTIAGPTYEVTQRLTNRVEVRRYAPYVVAEVLMAGAPTAASRKALPILAGYILGENEAAREFAVTAPLTQSAGQCGTLVRLALPRGTTLDSAPEPSDKRVKLRDVAGQTLAAIRYTGLWTLANTGQQLEQLLVSLNAAKVAWAGVPVFAVYNAPWTPWFLRRNELWVSLP